MVPPLNDTYGAIYLGIIIGAALWGVCCLQCWIYFFTYPRDSAWLKASVAAVMVADTVHQALWTASGYTLLVTNFAQVDTLGAVIRTEIITPVITEVSAVLVKSFFAYRIWILSGRNWYMTGAVVPLIVAPSVITVGYEIVGLNKDTIVALNTATRRWAIPYYLSEMVGDAYIAVAMCALLWKSRTGFSKTNNLVHRLIIYTVSTGLATFICALAAVIAFLLMPLNAIYIGIFIQLSRLYSNAMLASLNARSTVRINNADTTIGLNEPVVPLAFARLESPNRSSGGARKFETSSTQHKFGEFAA